MIVEKLKITNCGRHAEIDFDCNAAVVGIIGANGVGKSTILSMLKYDLTGEARDPIDTYVRDYNGNGKVEIDFGKNGKRGSIMRQFGATPKRELIWDGVKMKSAKEVDATIATILGADKKAVANAVFIEQGVLENILFTPSGERQKSFIQLVNLSFCEKRANIVDGKIKRLAATITDLGPAKDAAAEQRRLALETLDKVKADLEMAADWSAEVQYCEERNNIKQRVANLNLQLGETTNALLVVQGQIATRLQELEVPSSENVRCEIESKEAGERELSTKITSLQTVLGQFQHLDRVNRDIQAMLQEIGTLDTELKTLNGMGWTPNQWTEYQKGLGIKLRTLFEHGNVEQTLETERADVAAKQAAYNNLVVPETTPENQAKLEEVVQTSATDLQWLTKMLEVRLELASCVVGEAGKPVQCPKCQLTIQDGGDLDPKEIEALRTRIAVVTNSLTADRFHLSKIQKQWADYHKEAHRLNGLILDVQGRIQKQLLKQKTLPAKPTETKLELETEQQRVEPIIARLAQNPLDRTKATTRLRDLMGEKANYPLAIANDKNRAAFSQEIIVQHTQTRQAIQTALQKMRFKKSELDKLEARESEKQTQKEKLEAALKAAEEELTKEGTERLADMWDEFAQRPELEDSENCWSAITAELRVRQATYTTLLVRKTTAEEGYDATNARYHEIEQRIKQDEAKVLLVADLKKLRDLLSDDGLPMAFVRYQFEHLARITQEGLVKLNADFAIQIDRSRELAFSFVRLDETSGVEHSMNKLSGGQRVRLCVAFLMAVQQRLVKEVGLLVLDEPSTHLDKAGVEEVVSFLQGLQQTLQQTEHQIWVVDHTPEMERALEKCLILK